MILVSGFRYRVGADSNNYIYYFYHETPLLWEIAWDNIFEYEIEPFFLLILSIVKTIGGKFYIVQIIQSIFVNSLIFLYLIKHSKYPFTCFFIYFLWCYPILNFEEMRAGMSIAVCLFANDYIQEKKWFKSYLLYTIGILFHYSTALLFITPIMLFLRINIAGLVILLLSYALGFVIQQSLGNYIELFEFNQQLSEKAVRYSNHDVLFKENITILGILAKKVSLVFYSFFAYYFINKRTKYSETDIVKIQPFVIIGLICVVFSIPMPIFYRYIHFYQIYFIILFVHLFACLVKDSFYQMGSLSWVRALILFIPFFNVIGYEYYYQFNYYRPIFYYSRFYPYSSIFDKSVDEDREYFYKHWELGKPVNLNEY